MARQLMPSQCHLLPLARGPSTRSCANGGGQTPSNKAARPPLVPPLLLPSSHHEGQHCRLSSPRAEPCCGPHSSPPGAPHMGDMRPPPQRCCAPQVLTSTPGQSVLFGIAANSLQRNTPDFILPCRHVPHPLPNSLAPCTTRQVNTAGVSSLPPTHPHSTPQLSSPWGHCITGAGPALRDGRRGDSWSPWPHSPAVSILPAAFLASQAHAPWWSPALHLGDDPSSWAP